MIKFDSQNRIIKIEKDLYCVSIGTQANCAGIACILASIHQAEDKSQNEVGVDSMGNISEGLTYYGSDIPEPIIEAVFSGVREEIENQSCIKPIKFILVGVLYHPVDSNINMHKIAGKTLIKEWGKENA